MRKIVSLLLATAVIMGCTSSAENGHTQPAPEPAASQPCTHTNHNKYTWIVKYDSTNSLCARVAPPAGFERVKLEEGSFGDWLRHLPLKPEGSAVHLYSGKLKGRQDVHAAVIDIDPGEQDLQQCADAVMRLRGEYLYAQKNYSDLHFNFTSGHEIAFKKWSEGYRPKVSGNNVSMVKSAAADDSRNSFRKYMDNIFMYSGTISLSREMKPVTDAHTIKPGDVFVMAGSPGHAMIVVDVAENAKGEKVFMLAQSYMPAQEMHVVKNFNDAKLGPWFSADFGSELQTPEWTFDKEHLKRFAGK
jgi:hypothetical protein